jgi:ParB family chromosome partitioning protein
MVKHKFENSFNPLDEIKDKILKRDIPGARFLEVERIKIDPQVRKTFSEESIKELADSIKEVGLISPLTVKKIEGEENFLLIAGERRLRALKLLGETKAQVIVREIDDDKIELVQIIENLHREDVLPLELAEGYKMLQDKYELSLRDIAKKIGKGHAYVSEIVKILNLTDEEKEKIKNGEPYTKFTRKKVESVHNVDSDISDLSELKEETTEDQEPETSEYEQIRNLMPGETTKALIDDFYGQTPEPEGHEPAEDEETEEETDENEEPKIFENERPTAEGEEPFSTEEDQEPETQEPDIDSLIKEFNSKTQNVRLKNIGGNAFSIWASEEETLKDIINGLKKKYCK